MLSPTTIWHSMTMYHVCGEFKGLILHIRQVRKECGDIISMEDANI